MSTSPECKVLQLGKNVTAERQARGRLGTRAGFVRKGRAFGRRAQLAFGAVLANGLRFSAPAGL